MLPAHFAAPWGKTATPPSVSFTVFILNMVTRAPVCPAFITISDFMVGGAPGKGGAGIVAPAVKPSGQSREVHTQINGTDVAKAFSSLNGGGGNNNNLKTVYLAICDKTMRLPGVHTLKGCSQDLLGHWA